MAFARWILCSIPTSGSFAGRIPSMRASWYKASKIRRLRKKSVEVERRYSSSHSAHAARSRIITCQYSTIHTPDPYPSPPMSPTPARVCDARNRSLPDRFSNDTLPRRLLLFSIEPKRLDGSEQLNDPVSQHRLGDLDEADNVGAHQIITRLAVSGGGLQAGFVDAAHNAVQFLIHFLPRPGQAHAVL